MSTPAFILLIGLGLLFVIVESSVLKNKMPKMEDKKNTEGKLVDYIQSYDRKGTMWSGVYEFDVDGKTYKITSSVRKRPKGLIKR